MLMLLTPKRIRKTARQSRRLLKLVKTDRSSRRLLWVVLYCNYVNNNISLKQTQLIMNRLNDGFGKTPKDQAYTSLWSSIYNPPAALRNGRTGPTGNTGPTGLLGLTGTPTISGQYIIYDGTGWAVSTLGQVRLGDGSTVGPQNPIPINSTCRTP